MIWVVSILWEHMNLALLDKWLWKLKVYLSYLWSQVILSITKLVVKISAFWLENQTPNFGLMFQRLWKIWWRMELNYQTYSRDMLETNQSLCFVKTYELHSKTKLSKFYMVEKEKEVHYLIYVKCFNMCILLLKLEKQP